MTRECPSCGNIVEIGQAFCPMCGTKIETTNKPKDKKINKELESLLFTVNSNAEIVLSKNLGASLIGQKNYADSCKLESAYMEIIQNFPTESKAYIAYVDYMIKFIVKINSITNVFASTQYFIGDIDTIINRCRDYLMKAKEFADDSELEQILQLESLLSSEIESIARDDTIKEKQEKNKKIAKGCYIFLGVLFGTLILLWLIAEFAGI